MSARVSRCAVRYLSPEWSGDGWPPHEAQVYDTGDMQQVKINVVDPHSCTLAPILVCVHCGCLFLEKD